jgi:hypothetical protein
MMTPTATLKYQLCVSPQPVYISIVSVPHSPPQAECARCGLEQFFEKCMLIVERLERLGISREEFLILKVETLH